MKREILFEIVRDQQGDLLLEIPDTGIALFMPTDFWNEVIERVQKPAAEKWKHFPREERTRKDQVMEILKAAVRQQQREQEEADKRA